MLRRSQPRLWWFYDQWNRELTENYHLKKPSVSETYTRLSQGLERITPHTPEDELTPFEKSLKRAVLPISDALPVPRSIDPAYLSVNGEPVPQSYKFLPNNQIYEHLANSHLRWNLHPFEKLISPHASGYMEPLGPVAGNEELPYAVTRTPIGKLPVTIAWKVNYKHSSIHILDVSGDKLALVDDLRAIFPNKRVIMRRDRVQIHHASYDVARVVQHYLFAIGY